MTERSMQTPAAELVKRNTTRWPNESEAYRRARDALLVEAVSYTHL